MNPFMQQALELAQIRRGFCAPNPAVGCVVVKNNQVIATGYHMAAGQPHAEVDALNKLGEIAEGADLYVTLEPCCHWGKTPPCTQAIINAKIKKVFYGFQDPNPKVAGHGEATLKAAGIDCEYLASSQIDAFYQSYAYWTQTKKPLVTAKLALSLDGFVAGPKGERIDITGEEAKRFTFENRLHSDAILTTITTIKNDNPRLDVRLSSLRGSNTTEAIHIVRKRIYILDSHLHFRLTSQLMKTAEHITIFHQKRVAKGKIDLLQKNAIKTVAVRRNESGLNLEDVLKEIGKQGVQDLWVEAGPKCFNSFWQQGLLNRAYLYYSPKKLGIGMPGLPSSLNVDQHRTALSMLGDDTLLTVSFGSDTVQLPSG